MRNCQESITLVEIVNAVAIAIEYVEATKVVVASRVHVQRFVPHKQGPRVDLHSGETDCGCHHVKRRAGMVDWDDAEGVAVQEDPVGSSE